MWKTNVDLAIIAFSGEVKTGRVVNGQFDGLRKIFESNLKVTFTDHICSYLYVATVLFTNQILHPNYGS